MLDIKGTYFIKDENLSSVESADVLAQDGILIYEVMRVVDSVCLFLEDHYTRMRQTAKMIGVSLNVSESGFIDNVYRLIKANSFETGNIKVVVQCGNGKQSAFYYFISHLYPDSISYKEGVKTDLLKAERLNPQAKIFQVSLKEKTSHLIAEKKIYELILVDSNDRILEGSRTNIFFIKGKEFYTPRAELVLPGVTRRKVIECLTDLHFPCMEADIPSQSTGEYDAVFLSGTSPKILPVAKIGEQLFKTDHPSLVLLMEAYDGKIGAYIRNFRATGL